MSVSAAFRVQADNCAALGSPFMERIMTLAADRLAPGTPVTDRIFGWPGDISPSGDSVPLRLAGALHALRLGGHALAEVYPPHRVDDDRLWQAVTRAMSEHEAHVLAWLDRPPQTNEVRRAGAILPALALLYRETGLPVELLELGTSGGLNLRADRFRLDLPGVSLGPATSQVVLTPRWQGALPPTDLPPVLGRAGVDLAPLDPERPEDEARLLAYLWPDQAERIARTRAAIAVAAAEPAEISAADAGHWLAARLPHPAPDRLRVVFHTIAWQYFPAATKARATDAMRAASGPLARVAMEYDGGDGASVTIARSPDLRPTEIARADFHGRWIRWLV